MSRKWFDDSETLEAFEHAWDREHRKDLRDEKARQEEPQEEDECQSK